MRFLDAHAVELDLRLPDFTGGKLRNAIPRGTTQSRKTNWRLIEKNLTVLVDSVSSEEAALTE